MVANFHTYARVVTREKMKEGGICVRKPVVARLAL